MVSEQHIKQGFICCLVEQEGQWCTPSSTNSSSSLVQSLNMRTNPNAGLHFTPEGYKLMYKAVIKVTKEELPELCPENLPLVFPPWVAGAEAEFVNWKGNERALNR
jgi:hypothetical protein